MNGSSSSDDAYFSSGVLYKEIRGAEIRLLDYSSPRVKVPRILLAKQVSLRHAWNELKALQQVKGEPWAVRLYHSQKLDEERAVLYMEHCASGTLKYVPNWRVQWTDENTKAAVVALLRGLDRMHTLNIVHKDIKPGNIFVTSDMRCKFGDFGSSKHLKESRDLCSREATTEGYYCGRLGRRLGQMSRSEAEDVLKKMDMWSLGKTLLEFLSKERELQLADMSESQVTELVNRTLTDSWPEFVPIITNMLQLDYKRTAPLEEQLSVISVGSVSRSIPLSGVPKFNRDLALKIISEIVDDQADNPSIPALNQLLRSESLDRARIIALINRLFTVHPPSSTFFSVRLVPPF